MNIGILGGAFDPPHIGHVIVAEEIKTRLDLDEMWLLPVFSHAFNKDLSSPEHRLAMVKLVESDQVKASSYEIDQNKTSYTIDTLRSLEKKYPQDTFYFCLGSDLLKDFQKWKEWQKLVSNFKIVIYPRGNICDDLEVLVKQQLNIKEITSNISIVTGTDIVVTNISSSSIRNRLKEGKSVEYIVPKNVMEYIENQKLYKLSS